MRQRPAGLWLLATLTTFLAQPAHALQLLRIASVLVILALGLAPQVLAVPFPSITFHGAALSESGTDNPCDFQNCQGDTHGQVTDFLPQFGLVGKTLLSVEISYDIRSQVGASVSNGTASTVQAFAVLGAEAGFGFGNSQLFGVDELADNGGEFRTVPPGQTLTFTEAIAHVVDTVVLLPGDALFPQFLGQSIVEFHSGAAASLNGVSSGDQLLSPIIYSWDFQGDFDLTYTFCTPHAPGCPPAIPGFNSPVPAPATLLLIASGVMGLVAYSRGRRVFDLYRLEL